MMNLDPILLTKFDFYCKEFFHVFIEDFLKFFIEVLTEVFCVFFELFFSHIYILASII